MNFCPSVYHPETEITKSAFETETWLLRDAKLEAMGYGYLLATLASECKNQQKQTLHTSHMFNLHLGLSGKLCTLCTYINLCPFKRVLLFFWELAKRWESPSDWQKVLSAHAGWEWTSSYLFSSFLSSSRCHLFRRARRRWKWRIRDVCVCKCNSVGLPFFSTMCVLGLN